MNGSPSTIHVVNGHGYTIDEHRIIREAGPFQGLPAYAPYFWHAYLDGAFDDEQWMDGVQVVVFALTPDDRRDYPELACATKVFIWEDACGRLNIRVDRLA